MLSYVDILGMCDFSEEEIRAISRHAHLSGMQAIGLAETLLHRRGGAAVIRQMIVDDIAAADATHNRFEAGRLRYLLERFTEAHPESQDAG